MTGPAIAVTALSSLHVVTDARQLSAIQLEAATLGRSHGLEAEALERLGIVVAALAGNIARHAGDGRIILRAVGEHASGCVEILALDKGPGIGDIPRTMRDSATPAGGVPGDGGLSEIRLLSDLFDIYSHPGCGTALVAHVGSPATSDDISRSAEARRHGSTGAVCIPVHGETECGDGWAIESVHDRVTVLLADGLGHGPEAAIAARAAIAVFRDSPAETPERMLATMHTALRQTRGAALSVTVLDRVRRTAIFCGVGNVDARVVTVDTNRYMAPQNGIVGHTMPRPQCPEVPWPADGRLVMHSDGIASSWRLGNYPGLLARHPALLSGILFRDFARARDDATVVVVRDSTPVRD